jgi:hypothetical protein
VLSERSDPEFDLDCLQLVFNETASDLRSIGVDCAAVVSLESELPAAVVSVLYDCLYDVAYDTVPWVYPHPCAVSMEFSWLQSA